MGTRQGKKEKKKAIAEALERVRALVLRLRKVHAARVGKPEAGKVLFPRVYFGYVEKDLVDLYWKCVDALDEVHGKRPKKRLVGAGYGQEVLGQVLSSALGPGSREPAPSREAFERQLGEALGTAEQSLRAAPKEWSVVVRVKGFLPRVLPFTFGMISFDEGTPAKGAELAKAIVDIERTAEAQATWGAPHTIEDENRTRAKARSELADAFTGGAVASLVVSACDKKAAERIGLAHVRETIDIINFFSRFLDVYERQGRAYCAPEGPREADVWIVRPVAGTGMTWRSPSPNDPPVLEFDLKSDAAKACGAQRVHEMLCHRESRSDLERSKLEDRIVTALSWAGRANVEVRPEQAFIFYTVALESLLGKENPGPGVMARIPMRLTHLLGGDRVRRKALHEDVKRLYNLRNAIVHAGDSIDLQDADLEDIRHLTNYALTSMLIHPPYVAFRSVGAFDAWFEEQALGGPPTEPPATVAETGAPET